MSDAERQTPAISKVSDLETSGWQGRPGEAPPAEEDGVPASIQDPQGMDRSLPAPLKMRLKGGEIITLREDQIFFDRVVIRSGERGKALYPSSQAAAWVVHFPRVGPTFRVIPEPLLEVVP